MGAVGGARCRGATLKCGRVAAGGGGADASRPAPSDSVQHRGAVRAKRTRGVCWLQAAAVAEAAALRSKVEGWGISAAGVRAVCAARPPAAAEDAAARLFGAPALVTSTPVPPLSLPLAWRGSVARYQYLLAVRTAELEEGNAEGVSQMRLAAAEPRRPAGARRGARAAEGGARCRARPRRLDGRRARGAKGGSAEGRGSIAPLAPRCTPRSMPPVCRHQRISRWPRGLRPRGCAACPISLPRRAQAPLRHLCQEAVLSGMSCLSDRRHEAGPGG
jgi:hypothetical protein